MIVSRASAYLALGDLIISTKTRSQGIHKNREFIVFEPYSVRLWPNRLSRYFLFRRLPVQRPDYVGVVGLLTKNAAILSCRRGDRV